MFEKLTRTHLRKLAVGESITERGIVFTRLDGDGRWSINVMVARVRHHYVIGLESHGFTRTQCEEKIAELKAKKAERRHGIATKRIRAAVTFKEAAELYLQFLRATGGRDILKKEQRLKLHLVPHLGGLTLSTMTETDLARYCTARLAEKVERTGKLTSPATINRELSLVSHLLNLAADRRKLALIAAVPCKVDRLPEPKGPTVYLPPAEAHELLAAAEEDFNPHVECFAMIGLHTGMRASPILRIQVPDLDFDRLAIWIDRDKAGERQQPMTQELADYLRAYIAAHVKVGQVWLFPSSRSKTGHAVNIATAFRRVVQSAGFAKRVTPHTLRHSMATNAAQAGIDPATLQGIGGWKTRKMVERYTHAGEMAPAMARLQEAYSKGRVTQKLQDETAESS